MINISKKIYPERGRRVFVALSGGVDSSVSAALLVEKGYNVTGVFMRTWYPKWLSCSWREDRRDAMRVCAKLKIPFITLDFEDEYKKEVIDYMISGYRAGRTPNPDVMCNRQIKFGAFFRKARKMGADFVATGHYARLKEVEPLIGGSTSKQLLTGKDKNKDQSYFLWTLKNNQLNHILFPVGDLQKSEVRKLAKKYDLHTAQKKESQGLCFMGKVNVSDFLKRYIKEKKGRVVNEKGETVGSHNGVTFITLGQRHGFEITEKNTERKPYYVVSKNIKKNLLIVSHKKEVKKSAKNEIVIKNINWISDKPDFKKKYSAKKAFS